MERTLVFVGKSTTCGEGERSHYGEGSSIVNPATGEAIRAHGAPLGIGDGLRLAVYRSVYFTRRGWQIPANGEFIDDDDSKILGALAQRPK